MPVFITIGGGGEDVLIVGVVPIKESKSVRLNDIIEPEASVKCSFKNTCPTNNIISSEKKDNVVLSI
jgi:hypothetical protein